MSKARYRTFIGPALAAALCLPAATLAQTPEPQTESKVTPEQDAVIAAAVRYSIGYGVWIWEKKCNSLPAADRNVELVDHLAAVGQSNVDGRRRFTGAERDTLTRKAERDAFVHD